jgi:hypothetical protein
MCWVRSNFSNDRFQKEALQKLSAFEDFEDHIPFPAKK